jgi:hypothetical protein
MSDYDSVAAFLDLRQQPNGPTKKFALLKLFGEDLKEGGFTDARNMSCAEMEQCIGDRFSERYVADPAAFAHELLEDAEGGRRHRPRHVHAVRGRVRSRKWSPSRRIIRRARRPSFKAIAPPPAPLPGFSITQ